MTTPYTLPKTINNLTRWELVDYYEDARSDPPFCEVTIAIYGAGQTAPYCEKVLRLFDAAASGVLKVNADSIDRNDAVKIDQVSIAGAFSAYSAAFWANVGGTGTKAKHIAALQAFTLSKVGAADGIVGAEFAGALP